MSKTEITYEFYNRKNPKCRACKWYGNNSIMNSFEFIAECRDTMAPIRNKYRRHNSKACSHFTLLDFLKPHIEGDKDNGHDNSG